MGMNKYLNKIQEEKEIKKSDRLRCKICGRQVTIIKAGKGPLVCCGENMTVMGRVVEAGFSKYPKGWTQDTVKKFAKSLSQDMKGGPKSKGFFDKCVEKMKDKVGDAEGLCASIKDEVYGSTMWRGKDKPEAEVRKDTKSKQNV
jgi:desulfoferrodoxin-like iron-binding protein